MLIPLTAGGGEQAGALLAGIETIFVTVGLAVGVRVPEGTDTERTGEAVGADVGGLPIPGERVADGTGICDGRDVGMEEGIGVGISVGFETVVGTRVGDGAISWVGMAVGTDVSVGAASTVGITVGTSVGSAVGTGVAVGAGVLVGCIVGVGCTEQMSPW